MTTAAFLTGWERAADMVRAEATQLAEEGRNQKWIEAALHSVQVESASEAALVGLWERLQEAPAEPGFAYHEPNELAEIQNERTWPPAPEKPTLVGNSELRDRMQGAWLGRCCGCALGKPLELFMSPHQGLSSRQRISTYLRGVAPNEYPLHDYLPAQSSAQEKTGSLICPASQRENIRCMETDDDIRYTVLGLMVLLEKGEDFTTTDVMNTWISNLPYGMVCTAETQAYRNFVMRYRRHLGPSGDADWHWVATFQNPYREWIGAQIRADAWGYAAPGNPELAAEFAWRDARMSHVKNGIYGEMFVAAMIAAGFVTKDPLEVVRAGLAQIPARSRLHVEMEQVIAICERHDFKASSFEAVLDEIEALLGHYHPVHTNNNAALVVAALLLGQHDFEKVITIAVMGGWDTDCNGATAGSIFGAMHGADSIPAKWKDPLNDTLYSQIDGYHPIAISECAEQSARVVEKFAEQRV